MLSKKQGAVRADDRYYFGGDVVMEKIDDFYLVISVQTANWLVLTDEFQKILLEQFLEGKRIGDVFEIAKTDEHRKMFMQLLAAITSRQFACTDAPPVAIESKINESLYIYLTQACNLRCKHCFMQSGKKLDNELSKEEWFDVIRQFKDNGGQHVTFTGGEPLMNKDAADIIKFAHNTGLTVTVLTNGVLWTKEQREDLAKYIAEVQVSVDGVDEYTNSLVRGKGTFQSAVETVIDFAKLGVKTSMATTMLMESLDEQTGEKYLRLVEKIKSETQNGVSFNLSKKMLGGRDVQYTESQNQLYFQRMLSIEQEVNKDAYYSNFMDGHTPNSILSNCGLGGLSMASDGNVYLCNRISEVECYGNVRSTPLKYFLTQGEEVHKKTSVDNMLPCRDCELRYLCCGGCRIDDTNFKGCTKTFDGVFRQVKCTEEFKDKFRRRMVESYNYKYQF